MKSIAPMTRRINTRLPWRLCSRVIAIIGIFALTFQTTFAGPVLLNDVVQKLTTLQGTVDLQLRNSIQQQDAKGTKSGHVDSMQGGITPELPLGTLTAATPNLRVDSVEDAIVEGTVCDCGEILLPAAAGFPKWPLLFLAGIPLIFIGGGDEDCVDCNRDCVVCDTIIIPTPTPTPRLITTETPEPASLFLFGTGLLAFAGGLRRRYAKRKSSASAETEDSNS